MTRSIVVEGSADLLHLCERPEDVRALAERCARAEAIAVDVEADGLFAFRPKLCTLQLAFMERGALVVAVIDTLATPVTPMAEALSERGPVKLLHDLTFDARLLEESSAPLGNVRDTSVAARLLGYKEGGLAALLRVELGVELDKKQQQHDWSRRPLLPEQLRYLADDVRYLLALDARLADKARALGIEEEIAEECSYKLASAQRPPRDPRPAYARVKGAQALDAPGRAALRHLVDARDAAAEAADVPPFKIIGNEVLVELAKKRPTSTAGMRSILGAQGGAARRGDDAARLLTELRRAIHAGLRDGDVPADHRAFFEPVRLDRAAVARRKELEGRVSRWRRAEAKRRGVDEQAVLPGHCAQDLVSALAALDGVTPAPPMPDAALAASDGATPASPAPPTLDAALAAVARVPGLGEGRLRRYGDALAALGSPGPAAPSAPSATADPHGLAAPDSMNPAADPARPAAPDSVDPSESAPAGSAAWNEPQA